ncbi:hypothetical protein SAMN06295905_1349 [Devosia lucknowensis]|uniref:Uncharacterized protein n=1 Tax=Devosia lucknowensis TaxID=1096929 RepID=A0A1Y6ET46_9HYPH|nr:hypothetical protein [Devosia lucknowensis]SMQ65918.1 hypothetical protein SAMN06295905_1349 [Devosia lucknowensis]
MPRPRTPAAKAKATGRDKHDKGRFENRNEPLVNDDVGPPPDWMTDTEGALIRTAWVVTRKEIPWLNSSHRGLLEIAASIRGRLMAGQDVGVQALNLLRQALGQMGATPADASKAGAKPDGDQADPSAKYFD